MAVRFVAASPDLPSADVFLDGQKISGALAYRSVTPYRSVATGSHRIRVRQSGQTTVWVAKTFLLPEGGRYTVALLGTKGQPTLSVFALPPDSGAAGKARLSLFNFLPSGGNVDVLEPDFQNAAVKKNLGYSSAASRTFVPRPQRLSVVSSGRATPLLSVPRFVPVANHAYSVFLLSLAPSNKLGVVQVEDR